MERHFYDKIATSEADASLRMTISRLTSVQVDINIYPQVKKNIKNWNFQMYYCHRRIN